MIINLVFFLTRLVTPVLLVTISVFLIRRSNLGCLLQKNHLPNPLRKIKSAFREVHAFVMVSLHQSFPDQTTHEIQNLQPK